MTNMCCVLCFRRGVGKGTKFCLLFISVVVATFGFLVSSPAAAICFQNIYICVQKYKWEGSLFHVLCLCFLSEVIQVGALATRYNLCKKTPDNKKYLDCEFSSPPAPNIICGVD